MISESDIIRMRKEAGKAKSEAEQAKGVLRELMARLQSEFGCADVKQAQAKLDQMEKEKRELEKQFKTALADYERKWK